MSRCLKFIPDVPFIEADGRRANLGDGCWRDISWDIVNQGEINEVGSYLDSSLCGSRRCDIDQVPSIPVSSLMLLKWIQ